MESLILKLTSWHINYKELLSWIYYFKISGIYTRILNLTSWYMNYIMNLSF